MQLSSYNAGLPQSMALFIVHFTPNGAIIYIIYKNIHSAVLQKS